MGNSLSSEANLFSASQEFPQTFWNPKFLYRFKKFAAACLCTVQPQSSPRPQSTSWKFVLILSSTLSLGLPSGLFSSGFLTNTVYKSVLTYVLQDPSKTFFFIWSTELYFLMNKHHQFPLHLFFSTPLLPCASYTLIFPSAPCSQTPSVYIPPSIRTTKFDTHTRQLASLYFCMSSGLYF